jgi:phage terminase small subunit
MKNQNFEMIISKPDNVRKRLFAQTVVLGKSKKESIENAGYSLSNYISTYNRLVKDKEIVDYINTLKNCNLEVLEDERFIDDVVVEDSDNSGLDRDNKI